MYEERGPGRKVSVITRSWALLMQPFFKLTSPHLYSFQGVLPSLPIPSLVETRRKVFSNETIYLAFKYDSYFIVVFEECAPTLR